MLEGFYRIKEAAGLSIVFNPDGSFQIHVCVIAVNKDQLSITNRAVDIVDLERLKDVLPGRAFLSLNFQGKGVLYKQIEKQDDITGINFGRILPNATIDDFYVQNFISGNHSFVSLIRKNEVDKWVVRLQAQGFIPVMISLGPFPVQNILSQLNFYDPTITFNGYAIYRDAHGNWESWSFQDDTAVKYPIKIQSEPIAEELLIPYATAFQLVLSERVEPINAGCNSLTAVLNDNLQSRRLKAQGVFVLCVVFLLLLLNFIFFSWLNTANNKLLEQVSKSTQNADDIGKIDSEIQRQESLLKSVGYEQGVNKSSLLDQVASMLPPELTWRSAEIDPLDVSASRQERIAVFSTHKIRITGTSEKIVPVNEWIERIKTKPWVKNVQLDSYNFNSELNTGQYTVLITY